MALPSRGKRLFFLDDFSTTAQLHCILTSTTGYRDSDLTVLLLNIFYSHMSMLSVCKQVSTTVTKVRLSPLLQQVRFAGGGGRPGGKPTLNWRQKQQLRIARKDQIKLAKQGFIDDEMDEWLKAQPGYEEIDLTNVENYEIESPITDELYFDTRRQFNASSLFGSNKSAGGFKKKLRVHNYKYGKK